MSYAATMPNDILVDVATLSRKVGEAQVVFAVSRGGIPFRVQDEIQNIDFDRKRYPIAGLDRKINGMAEISGRFIIIGSDQLADLMPGATVTTAAGPPAVDTITPHEMSTLIAEGDLITELTWKANRLGGGFVSIVFDLALCTQWEITGEDKNVMEVQATFQPRLKSTDAASSLDTVPWHIEVADAAT